MEGETIEKHKLTLKDIHLFFMLGIKRYFEYGEFEIFRKSLFGLFFIVKMD